jgi:mannose-1-phosphate guanylyltransferase
MANRLHAVVIAGGSGTRFWPLSRRARPKQLLALGGDETLLAGTFRRIAPLVSSKRWWMVVGEGQAEQSYGLVREMPRPQLLVEPAARNTAPAVGLAAVHLMAREPEAIMVVLPADHHVRDAAALCEAIDRAAQLAANGPIVTLGITPTRPETGYGYIERGAADARVPGAFRVRRFCEKPDLEQAKAFLSQGGFAWNAGIFVMRASTVLREMARQLPDAHRGLLKVQQAIGTPEYGATLARAFAEMPSISFDYGVMEGAEDAAVVPVDCGWSDVGSWNALDALVAKDDAGNVTVGRTVAIDSKDCVLYSDASQLVATIGLRGVAVVHTRDATLVVPVERAQEVRQVLTQLGDKGWNEYL